MNDEVDARHNCAGRHCRYCNPIVVNITKIVSVSKKVYYFLSGNFISVEKVQAFKESKHYKVEMNEIVMKPRI